MKPPSRMNSIRNRLVLLIFAITAGAVGFVYLYVVPQLESSLTAEKLRRLEDQSREAEPALERALLRGASQEEISELVRQISQQTDARLTLLAVEGIGPEAAPTFVIADSEAEPTAVLGGYAPAAAALEGDRIASGVESIAGERVGESAVPIAPDGERALGRGALEPAGRGRRQRRPDPAPDPDRRRRSPWSPRC